MVSVADIHTKQLVLKTACPYWWIHVSFLGAGPSSRTAQNQIPEKERLRSDRMESRGQIDAKVVSSLFSIIQVQSNILQSLPFFHYHNKTQAYHSSVHCIFHFSVYNPSENYSWQTGRMFVLYLAGPTVPCCASEGVTKKSQHACSCCVLLPPLHRHTFQKKKGISAASKNIVPFISPKCCSP